MHVIVSLATYLYALLWGEFTKGNLGSLLFPSIITLLLNVKLHCVFLSSLSATWSAFAMIHDMIYINIWHIYKCKRHMHGICKYNKCHFTHSHFFHAYHMTTTWEMVWRRIIRETFILQYFVQDNFCDTLLTTQNMNIYCIKNFLRFQLKCNYY